MSPVLGTEKSSLIKKFLNRRSNKILGMKRALVLET